MSELYNRFDQAARLHSRRIAVTADDDAVEYGQLERWVGSIAEMLRAADIEPEGAVGVCCEPGPGAVAAVLAAARVGAAYVPVDPSTPAERAATIIREARVRVVLTTGEAPLGALAATPTIDVDSCRERRQVSSVKPILVHDGQLLYVLFTSGSTGAPKPVAVTHGNVASLLTAAQMSVGASPEDAWTLFHSLSFDFSVWELWGALATGGRLVIVPRHTRGSPAHFYELLRQERITILNQTPSAFYALISVDDRERAQLAVNRIIFGGERLDCDQVRAWRARSGRTRVRLINMYGITETTVHTTIHELDDNDPVGTSVIGVPLGHASAVVMTDRFVAAAPGEPGELYIGGAGVSRGYQHRPDLTAERFVPDPAGKGQRLYRTGDVAVAASSGLLEYRGRLDQQIKLRGHRIEPAEIEHVFEQHPSVGRAVVNLVGDHVGGLLRADLVAAPGATVDVAHLRAFARQRLPGYMIPSRFVLHSEFPWTATGKIDRARIRELEGETLIPPQLDAALQDDTLRVVCGVLGRALGVAGVRPEDNFFELGGHSLLLVEVAMEIKTLLGVELDHEAFFHDPTARTIVDTLAATHDRASTPVADPLANEEAFRSFLQATDDAGAPR